MIKYLKPFKINSPKIRLGAKLDGGYVAPKIAFEKCNTLMAYGYGGDKTYEDDFNLEPQFQFEKHCDILQRIQNLDLEIKKNDHLLSQNFDLQ